jgi:MFS family permease
MINRHFDRNRGMALAFALCGTGLAAFILPPVASRLIEAYGWRGAYAGIALAGFLIVFPMTPFWFRGKAQAAPAGSAEPVASLTAQPPSGSSPRAIKLSNTTGAFHWSPSWFT